MRNGRKTSPVAGKIKFTLNFIDLNLFPRRPFEAQVNGADAMLWNLEKLEQERVELIEVITALSHVERLSQDEHSSIFEKIAAHMGRLSELDAEKQRVQSALEAV